MIQQYINMREGTRVRVCTQTLNFDSSIETNKRIDSCKMAIDEHKKNSGSRIDGDIKKQQPSSSAEQRY